MNQEQIKALLAAGFTLEQIAAMNTAPPVVPVAPVTDKVSVPPVPPVSTRVIDGKVQLSRRRLADLAKIADPAAREQLRGVWIKEALEQAESDAFWRERRNTMSFIVNEARPEGKNKKGKKVKALEAGRFLYVPGTGTKASAVFTKPKALEFIRRFEEFKAAVASMPDFTTAAPTDEEGK